nr:cytochrome c oxidase subunit 3 [Raillietina sp. HL-2022]
MSVIPLFGASFVGIFLIGVFFWKLWLVSLFFLLMVVFIVACVHGSVGEKAHYEAAFWLFIFSEIMVFGTLFFCCFYYGVNGDINLSDSLEIPFLGCFLLLGSSITITGFHHLLEWSYSWILLVFTLILGAGFVGLQIYEIWECDVSILSSSYCASSFCTVGAHSIHVLLGVIAMHVLLYFGSFSIGEYYCTVVTWYWHFVDYIWLFVYMIVYVC